MRSLFEAVIYASFVFILPFSLLPSGIKLIVNWAWTVIWIQFWPPLYAILNYIASIVAENTTGSFMRELLIKDLAFLQV